MRFEFSSAGRIVFGPGTIEELPAIAAGWSRRAFVVTGRDKIRHAGVIADLEAAGFHCSLFGIPREPDLALVREGVAALRAAASGVVIAIGGGSAIDAGKAIAAIAANPGDVLDYLEVIGKGQALEQTPIPFIAVPTTAGTGSEVTRNAVLGSAEHGVKASLRSPLMLARVAIVDPGLTMGLPREITVSSGLDALTQLIEPFVCNRANPMVDAICRDGLRVAARCLPRVCADGRDAEARAGMSYASLLGGLALSNAGLGVVHGFAAPIGGMFPAPHGAICAALLRHGMAANVRALRTRAPDSEALIRYEEIDRILGGMEWVNVPGLRELGVTEASLPEIAAKAERASSMKANPVVLTRDELIATLAAAL
ncbi:MAG: iron-containing alcohol dehydrogenase [Terriglobia bacterium]